MTVHTSSVLPMGHAWMHVHLFFQEVGPHFVSRKVATKLNLNRNILISICMLIDPQILHVTFIASTCTALLDQRDIF
jgi:hypothetical protein